MTALCLGIPIISYEGRDDEEVFKDRRNIIFVKIGVAKALANKIKMLWGNERLRKEIGEKGKELFEEFFSWEIISKKYEEFF